MVLCYGVRAAPVPLDLCHNVGAGLTLFGASGALALANGWPAAAAYVIAAVAEPLGNIDSLTVISTEGASAVTKTIGRVTSEVPKVVKDLTGLDLGAVLGSLTGAALSAGRADAGPDAASGGR